MIKKVKSLLSDKKVKQVGSLYFSMILSIVFGVIVSIVNTRLLGPESFGDYKFIQSVYAFFAVILAFGFLVTVGKLLAEKKNDSIRKELIGSSIVILSIIGFVFLISILIFSVIQKNIFSTDMSALLIMLLPLFYFIPFLQGFENIYQGENRIYELSVFRVAPQILYVSTILLVYRFGVIDLQTALITHLSTIGAVILSSIYLIKPSFNNLKSNIKYILHENRLYGFNVYVGSVIGVASSQLAPLAISFFSDSNTDVGYFSLALTITMPLAFIPTVAGTTMFKEFANRNAVSKKSTKITLLISVFSLVMFVILIKPVIIGLYSKKFLAVINLTYIVAIGQVFYGFGNYYNRFLGSKGQGKSLRNGAIYVGLTNLIGYVILIPYYGAAGAAITQLISGLVFISSMLYYYGKFMKDKLEEI